MKKSAIKKKTPPKKIKVVVKKSSKRVNKENVKKPAKTGYPAWTMPEYLSKQDHKDLQMVYDLVKNGKPKDALEFASGLDTIIREAIPEDVWEMMGGRLIKKIDEKNSPVVSTSPTTGKSNEDIESETVEIKFNSVTELDQLILVNSETLFGVNVLLFVSKSESPEELPPQQFLIDFSVSEKPRLFLIETALAEENFGQHFVRITHLFAELRSKKDHAELAGRICEIIEMNKAMKNELMTRMPDIELQSIMASLLVNHPCILLILDGEKSELPLLAQAYNETWGRMLKTFTIRRFSNGDEESLPVAMPFSEILKNEKRETGLVRCTEEDHLNAASEISGNIYKEIKEAILKVDGTVDFNVKKIYISVRKGKNLAFFHLRKKISLVVMSPEDYTRTQIKHHEIKSLPASVQKFWNGPSCTIVIENYANLAEVINLLKKLVAKA